MALTEEDIRAAAYRATLARREAYEKTNRARLAGSATARRELQENWQPVIDWQKERDDCESPDDPDA